MSTLCKLPEVLIVESKVFGDQRGWFFESYSMRTMRTLGITNSFVQDNHSFSKDRGVIRGLHYQKRPMDQAKLVRCTSGEILDVAIDIRKGSPNFGRWFGTVLSADNKRQLYIPRGFAHGFLTLVDNCEVQYKADNFYSPEHDRGIRFNDPDIGIEWGIKDPILSDKDSEAPFLRECDNNFSMDE